MRNRLKFVRRVVYKFKRAYGLPVDYYRTESHTTDMESGDKVTVLDMTHIRKVVVLRAREFRSFVYDLAYISANKDFTTGGFFDPSDRRIVIDPRDLAVGVIPTVDDYCIFNNSKYEVKEVFDFEDAAMYILLARKVKGSPIVRIENTYSVMDLTQAPESTIQDKLERSPSSTVAVTQTIEENP